MTVVDLNSLVRILAKADGLDWDELCAYEVFADDAPDDCDSSTCIAANYEDHDPDLARKHYYSRAQNVLTLVTEAHDEMAQRITRLEEALRPFVTIKIPTEDGDSFEPFLSDNMDDSDGVDVLWEPDLPMAPLTVGQFRRAHAALTGEAKL